VVATLSASTLSPDLLVALAQSRHRLTESLNGISSASELPDIKGAKEAEDFTDAAQQVLQVFQTPRWL
jgi:hypothetical protein